jgi:hypothetical protein
VPGNDVAAGAAVRFFPTSSAFGVEGGACRFFKAAVVVDGIAGAFAIVGSLGAVGTAGTPALPGSDGMNVVDGTDGILGNAGALAVGLSVVGRDDTLRQSRRCSGHRPHHLPDYHAPHGPSPQIQEVP